MVTLTTLFKQMRAPKRIAFGTSPWSPLVGRAAAFCDDAPGTPWVRRFATMLRTYAGFYHNALAGRGDWDRFRDVFGYTETDARSCDSYVTVDPDPGDRTIRARFARDLDACLVGCATLALSEAGGAHADMLDDVGLDGERLMRGAIAASFLAWSRSSMRPIRPASRRVDGLYIPYVLVAAGNVVFRDEPGAETVIFGDTSFSTLDAPLELPLARLTSADVVIRGEESWWRSVVCDGIAVVDGVLVLAARPRCERSDERLWEVGLARAVTQGTSSRVWYLRPDRGYVARLEGLLAFATRAADAVRRVRSRLASRRRQEAAALVG